jgi:hypothetical protein
MCQICVTPGAGPPAVVLHLCNAFPADVLHLCHACPADVLCPLPGGAQRGEENGEHSVKTRATFTEHSVNIQ